MGLRVSSFLLFVVLGVVCSCNEKANTDSVSPRVNHVMLYVSDIDESIQFYTTAFDFEVTNRLNELIIRQSDGNEQAVEVNMAFLKFPGQDFVYEISEQSSVSDTLPSPHFQHVGIDVDNVEDALEKALQAGGVLHSPIRSVGGNGVSAKIAFIKGPDGEIVELMQLISGEF